MDEQKKEYRKHPRLHQAFPVKFQFLDENGNSAGKVYEGFTRNIAKGGLSIEFRYDTGKEILEFIPEKTKLKLTISVLSNIPDADATAIVKWSTKICEPAYVSCFFGVQYEQIDSAKQLMIERHIYRLRNKPKIFLYFFLIACALVIVFAYIILVVR